MGYILRRLLLMIPTLLGVTIIVFSMVRLLPGDPALAIAGVHATQEYIEQVREALWLDKPLYLQYGRFLAALFRGDLGRSTRTDLPVAVEIWPRFINTLKLTTLSLFLATVVGMLAGIVSATRPYSLLDYGSMLGALVGVSTPVFWLGLMLMLLLSVRLGWLPSAGKGTALHYVLPAITLGAASLALIARITRASMLEVFRLEYITTARAKGLAERVVILRHALRNALIPVVTVIGLRFGMLLGGAVLTESVFAWPGVGRLMVESILARDYPVVQGAVLLLAAAFVFINLAVDLLYCALDPRIRYD